MVSFFLVRSAEWFGFFQFFKILIPTLIWTVMLKAALKKLKPWIVGLFLYAEKSTKCLFCCSAEANLLELVCYGKFGFSRPEISQLKISA